jgi:papain like protease
VTFFRRGLHPTSPDRKIARKAFREKVGLASISQGAADLTPYAPKVLNQGNSETCWAHSAATLLYTRRNIDGVVPITLASPLYFAQCQYAMYRAASTPPGQPLPPLQDQGAQLDDAARTFAQWGSIRFGEPQQDGGTDVPDTSVTAIPELKVPAVETGATVPFGGEHDITPDAIAPSLVALALDRKVPVWIGGLVGQAVQALGPGDIEQVTPADDPTAGGHARAILGYRTVGGAPQFLIRNSWGTSWGTDGNSWAVSSVIANAWSLLPFEVA